MTNKYVAWFEEVDKNDIGIVGGKGANLGEMTSAGFPVPYGFIVTAQSYFLMIEENDLKSRISSRLAFLNYANTQELNDASIYIQNLIMHATIPKVVVQEISRAYSELALREQKIYRKKSVNMSLLDRAMSFYHNPIVAVRSSATAEDLPDASFAGQQESYLNVKGENHLLTKIRECWASLFTERAMYYRAQNHFDHMEVGLAAVVQRMIQSDVSGIAFSIDPVSNDNSVITIEAIYGLGEYIVQGKVTPDHYEIIKKDFSILKKEIKIQNKAFIHGKTDNKEIKVLPKLGSKQKLSDPLIISLAKIIKNIEAHYFFPQDIEWALEKGQLFVVQSRPITTIRESEISKLISNHHNEILLTGDPASPGIGSGKPVIVSSPKEIDKVTTGCILVAPLTDPDYVPAMKKASAIVTETGGRTSHAAIVSRELGIPAIVGAENATKILKNESIITVNGTTGEITKGKIDTIIEKNTLKSKENKKPLHTLTKIYVNLAEVERAEEVSKMDVDGVGLLRAEFMIADIGVHPKEFIKKNVEHIFIHKLSSKLQKFAKAFNPRPVIYRATDFKTNEYRHLKGGDVFEPSEENPMIGYRGAARYIVDREVFKMELEAIKRVRDEGFKNLHLMIPFVRAPFELAEIRTMLSAMDMLDLPSFKLWIMVEIPGTAIGLDDYIALGIDGVSVGTNDLTMLTLGVDRDNASVASLYNETDPAVLFLLERIIKTCRRHNVTVSICGQAASDFPEVRELLVKSGVTSLSVNIDSVDKIRKEVYEIEKNLWQKSKK